MIAIIIVAVPLTFLLLYLGWEDYQVLATYRGPESLMHGEIVRNYGLTVVAIVATALAFWRSQIADDHAKTAAGSLNNARYQHSAAMLANRAVSVRIGAIYSLGQLARDYPIVHHIQAMQTLAAFVRHPGHDYATENKTEDETGNSATMTRGADPRDGGDINAVADVIRQRRTDRP